MTQFTEQTAQFFADDRMGVLSARRSASSEHEEEAVRAFDRIYQVYKGNLGDFFESLRQRKHQQPDLPFTEIA